MASYQKVYYCKNCKTNVTVDEKGHCKRCGATNIKVTHSVRFRCANEEGKEVQKRLSGYSTKKEAHDAYIKFMATAKNYKPVEESSRTLTFEQLYEEYKTFIQPRVKRSTYQSFTQRADNHIIDYFKNYKVKEITPKIILTWQNTLEQYSYNYKSHLRTTLSNMLKYAEKYYDIPCPIKKVDPFKKLYHKKEMSIWTPEQFESVMSKVTQLEYKVFYSALFYTGARKGEIMATGWNDWDLTNNFLNIDKAVTKKIKNEKYWVDTTKNATSTRKIKISDNLANLIKQLKDSKQDLDRFVFGGSEPLPETNILRHLNNAADLAEIPHIRIHDLRHSHASYLISQGVSIVAVAKRLGHKNIEQTLNTYAHMMPNEEDELIKKLEKIYKK